MQISFKPRTNYYKQLILTKLCQCKTLKQLKQVQSLIVVLGHSQTQYYAANILRSAVSAADSLSYARRIFSSLRSPNAFLFAALIAAHADRRRHRDAVELYRLMLRLGHSKPNRFVYPQLLRSSAEALAPRARASVHAQIVKTGLDLDPVVMTGLVSLYAKFPSEIELAQNLFDEMPQRTTVARTALISGHFRAGSARNAVSLFEAVPGDDVAAWNAVISGSAQRGLFDQALSLFARLMDMDSGRVRVRPNRVTLASVLSACGPAGSLRLGERVHCYAVRNSLLDHFVSNALIDMYGKCGHCENAARVFHGAVKKCLTSWNSMINCYAINGQSEKSIALFNAMILETRPNDITFVGILKACAHGGLVERGLAYFELMKNGFDIDPKIDPKIEHFGCLIDLLSRAGRFDEAMEFIREMGFEPDEAIWGSLLNGCKIHRRPDLAEAVVRRVMEIDPSNGGYFRVLASIYGELGNFDEVRNIRKMLKRNERLYCKNPGWSWVEVEGCNWKFYSSDNSHPRVEEIYCVLESLGGYISV